MKLQHDNSGTSDESCNFMCPVLQVQDRKQTELQFPQMSSILIIVIPCGDDCGQLSSLISMALDVCQNQSSKIY